MTARTLTITVTPLHELHGHRWSGHACPIALAINDAVPSALAVVVGTDLATVYGMDGDRTYRLPEEATEYIILYDNCEDLLTDGARHREFVLTLDTIDAASQCPEDAAMNRERILHLADVIEASDSYDQDHYTHPCHTPACIAGHAVAEFDPVRFAEMSAQNDFYGSDDHAADLLGLDHLQKRRLFALHGFLNGGTGFKPLAKDAAQTLRNLANTGEVYWDL